MVDSVTLIPSKQSKDEHFRKSSSVGRRVTTEIVSNNGRKAAKLGTLTGTPGTTSRDPYVRIVESLGSRTTTTFPEVVGEESKGPVSHRRSSDESESDLFLHNPTPLCWNVFCTKTNLSTTKIGPGREIQGNDHYRLRSLTKPETCGEPTKDSRRTGMKLHRKRNS